MAFAALYAPGEYVGELVQSTVTTVVTAGTRVQITTTSTPCTGVVVTADENNTGIIVVGGVDVLAASGTTRRGFAVLQPGAAAVIPVRDMSILYVDATNATTARVLAAPIKG